MAVVRFMLTMLMSIVCICLTLINNKDEMIFKCVIYVSLYIFTFFPTSINLVISYFYLSLQEVGSRRMLQINREHLDHR